MENNGDHRFRMLLDKRTIDLRDATTGRNFRRGGVDIIVALHAQRLLAVQPPMTTRRDTPHCELTLAQQRRAIFLLQKYLQTVNKRPGDKSHSWDLTKCDDETRKLFAQIGVEF